MSRYAFSGSRDQRDTCIPQIILGGLFLWQKKFREKITIIHADANGVDTVVERIATDLGLEREKFEADWDRFGKTAGHRRNQRMINVGDPNIAFCLKNDFGRKRGVGGKIIGGTEDFARRCLEADIPVYLIKQLDWEDLA